MDIHKFLQNEREKTQGVNQPDNHAEPPHKYAGLPPHDGTHARQVEANAQKNIKRYSGMSEQQLMNEMFKVAAGEKNAGNLDAHKLEEFYKKTAPMLNPQQRNKMRAIINQLK